MECAHAALLGNYCTLAAGPLYQGGPRGHMGTQEDWTFLKRTRQKGSRAEVLASTSLPKHSTAKLVQMTQVPCRCPGSLLMVAQEQCLQSCYVGGACHSHARACAWTCDELESCHSGSLNFPRLSLYSSFLLSSVWFLSQHEVHPPMPGVHGPHDVSLHSAMSHGNVDRVRHLPCLSPGPGVSVPAREE